jgi:hypothetical protein
MNARPNPYASPPVAARPLAKPVAPPPDRPAPLPLVRSLAGLEGSFHDAKRINEALAFAEANYNLISPASSCGELPEGWDIALSAVRLNTNPDRGHIYPHRTRPGMYALTKSALDLIAGAAGASWIPHATRRLDDGLAPYYWAFTAACVVEHFDGTEMIRPGTKELDLRDGSPEYLQMIAQAHDGKDPQATIRFARVHGLRLAESKAKNAAIRSLGVKSAYTLLELDLPFVVARRYMTGRSEDPEMRKFFAAQMMARRGEATRALYLAPTTPLLSAPPVGESRVEDDEERAPAPRAQHHAAPREQVAPPDARPANDGRALSGFKVPGKKGQDHGKPIEHAKTDNLVWWATKLANDAANNGRYADKDKALREAIHAELKHRNEGSPEAILGDDEIAY